MPAPISSDFSMMKMEDGIVVLSIAPPVAIGAWNIRFTVQHHFDGTSNLVTKSTASGYVGSGITIANSGQGVINIALNSADTSGWDYKAYAFQTERLDSGNRQVLSQGYFMLLP
mgnify:CR=1 FL=1